MLWQKDTHVEDWVTRFTVGQDYEWDTLLLPYDVEGTRGHAWGLTQIDILSDQEFGKVNEGLDALLEDYADGKITVTPQDEDCHTVIEQYLTDKLGIVGKKIHTGRSRNDQVLTALRLFLREQLHYIAGQTAELTTILCDLGATYDRALMPGYTHLQRAMPTTAGLWALGYAELMVNDLNTLKHAVDQINVSPLGSAAGYGVPYIPLPRQEVAQKLGFGGVQTHVTAVQLSRGKLELEVVHALVQTAATINRMASDLVQYNMTEFNFVALPAEYCTGSSIMPQKQNPDVLELARATYHRLLAEMQVLLTLPANLPSGYHRDLQLTKEAVMRSVLLTQDLLTAMLHLIPGVRFRTEVMESASTSELYATAYALEAVLNGIPFREAYRQAARQLETMDAPDVDAALAAYQVDGFPGKLRPDLIRDAVSQQKAWIQES